MTLRQSILLIERYLKEQTKDGDSTYALELSSELERNGDEFVVMYRADILYMHSGLFEQTITLALISLGKELKRLGYK